jgi:hypothetical protein
MNAEAHERAPFAVPLDLVIGDEAPPRQSAHGALSRIIRCQGAICSEIDRLVIG